MQTVHKPVLLAETIQALAPGGKLLADGTLGGGGHTRAMLEAGAKRIIAFDRDEAALTRTLAALPHGRITGVHANFNSMAQQLEKLDIEQVDGILLDLGYSSDQMDDPARGLSYQASGPLDMRLDPEQALTAAVVVNTFDEARLADIFYHYGEEPKARQFARAIATRRKTQPFETTSHLRALVEEFYPPRHGLNRSHPAARAFQALRIAVNHELDDLAAIIPQAANLLAPGGRLAIITFNSLEDRMVKDAYRNLAADTLDSVGRVAKQAPFKAWKKIEPEEAEVEENRRARSCKLRVLERLA